MNRAFRAIQVLPLQRISWIWPLLRYGIVSLVALLADSACLVFLVETLAVDYRLAAAAGFAVGCTVAYQLSRRWVFSETRGGKRAFLSFVAVGIASSLLGLALIALLVEQFKLDYRLAKAVSAGFSFILNYVFRRLILIGRPVARGGECIPS